VFLEGGKNAWVVEQGQVQMELEGEELPCERGPVEESWGLRCLRILQNHGIQSQRRKMRLVQLDWRRE
jgi:hypothetical protein